MIEYTRCHPRRENLHVWVEDVFTRVVVDSYNHEKLRHRTFCVPKKFRCVADVLHVYPYVDCSAPVGEFQNSDGTVIVRVDLRKKREDEG